ncbi:Uncharacterised protein [Zhongshania aliphaticivorans]|uniref:Flagellar protein FliT n=1 Tax=Zhongshania aliphaticivorans TaxID=1470434 RepID=A0A5S9NLH6_9GAMM|nr:flagellar protein FliT [Zhongshania aliphaticivorans]CAA0090795.1 Uncharacterised protein [Zhongshania aliphaticivorans]CAA0098290.1 Uncharacterised protein [Zhongshania aliphaticivorans]
MNKIENIATELSERQQSLQALMSLTVHIRELAESNDWVAALEEQRRRRIMMDDFFAMPCTPMESGNVASVIEGILAIDQEVSDMLYRQRGTMRQEANQSRKNIRNVDRYLSNSPA